MGNPEYGKSFDTTYLQTGLRYLNSGLHFDMGAALNLWHPRMKNFQGVFYDGTHICTMDRGVSPEFKLWSVVTGAVEIPPEKVSTTPGAWVSWEVVDPSHPEYKVGLEKALKFDDGYALEDGKLKKYKGFALGKRRGPVVKVGWRHTFEAILQRNLANVTRSSLAYMFDVDMLKFPMGSPQEVAEALLEE